MIPLHHPSDALRPTAIALGSFDGLHPGHRRVIAAITGVAADHPHPGPPDVPTVVSFWPHPREVLHGESRLRLDLPAEKLALLEPLGIRQLVLVPFTPELAALSPAQFVQQVLVEQLQARRVAVGENFRFGAGRQGDAATLQQLGAAAGMAVQLVPMLHDADGRLSSSRIRQALATGDLRSAEALLQRPYGFSGRVVRGRGLGRELGWPTANLQVDGRKLLPLEGVYAARAWLADAGGGAAGAAMAAVMNLGPQPTVDPLAPSAVEVHLLDRQIQLEGAQLWVEPVLLLRRQQRFSGLEALCAQISRDADSARQVLASAGGVGVGEPPGDEQTDATQEQQA